MIHWPSGADGFGDYLGYVRSICCRQLQAVLIDGGGTSYSLPYSQWAMAGDEHEGDSLTDEGWPSSIFRTIEFTKGR